MKKNPRSIGVLFSGGLDSAALIGEFVNQGVTVWPIYISCGLRWERAELGFAQRYLNALSSKRLKPLSKLTMPIEDAYRSNWSISGKIPSANSDDRKVFLPARNLLLCVKAMLSLSSKGVNDLALATLKGNPFDDATSSYFQDLESVLQRSFKKKVRLHTPFRGFSKTRVIADHRDLPLEFSLSCINPKGLSHCGKCNKCAERIRAFSKAHVPDKTLYLKRAKTLSF